MNYILQVVHASPLRRKWRRVIFIFRGNAQVAEEGNNMNIAERYDSTNIRNPA